MINKQATYFVDLVSVVVDHDNEDAIQTTKEAYKIAGLQLTNYLVNKIVDGTFDSIDINNNHNTITTVFYSIIDNTTTTETITIRRS